MNVIIKQSDKTDKKIMAVIDNKKPFTLVQKCMKTIQHTKIIQ